MTLWEARRKLVESFMLASPNRSHMIVDSGSFQFTLDSFEFDAVCDKKREHFKVDLKNLEPAIGKFSESGFMRVKSEAGKDLSAPLNRLVFFKMGVGAGESLAYAQSLANALNSLRYYAGDAGDPLRAFAQRATAWRTLATKPPIPEEVRVQRLLAENAIKENNPNEALFHYVTGVELYPIWPEGNFNAALIAAELHLYAEAIEHMQAYLELVPDAPDAQAARDKIVIWRSKITQ
jgi:tetratricopeptide (TPR) repeat protein